MKIIDGITYNIRGLFLGLKTPKLLFWGFVRFFMVIAITIFAAMFILSYQEVIMKSIWSQPESAWVLWLWHVLSWLLSLILVGVSAVISYLISQILFSVIIMDHMSRITEMKITGEIKEPQSMPLIMQFIYLIKQEIPRTIIPVMISLILMLGGLTPLGPVLAIISSCIAAIFLSWDNTDLLPARRLFTFKERFSFLKKNIIFHLGFGLPFLIPVLNILFLSFAPIGATIYQLDKNKQELN